MEIGMGTNMPCDSVKSKVIVFKLKEFLHDLKRKYSEIDFVITLLINNLNFGNKEGILYPRNSNEFHNVK